MKLVLFIGLFIGLFLSCSQNEIPSDKSMTVLIDIAHGGKDPGAMNKSGVKEKDLALNYAKFINNELLEKKLNVINSRTEDEFVSLFDRVQMAESKSIDVIVSIHFNTSADSLSNGIKTYFKPTCEKSMALDSIFHKKVLATNLIKDNGGEPWEFFVLKNSPVPAVLINVGYLSNEEENKLLNSDEFKTRFTNVLSESLVQYFQI